MRVCRNCGFLFAGGDVDPTALRRHMQTAYAARHVPDLAAAWDEAWRHTAARRRRAFLTSDGGLPTGARVLEVGCYIGAFLAAGRQAGWRIEGLDPDPRVADFAARRAGTTVHAGLVEEFTPPAKATYDQICLFHVLAHLAEPVAALRRIRDWLTDGGRVCIEVPDADACGGGYWRRFFESDDTHLWFFDRGSLAVVLGRAGYRVEPMRCLPAYAGRRGAILLTARRGGTVEALRPRGRLASAVRRLRLRAARLNWRCGVGPVRRTAGRIRRRVLAGAST